MLRRGLPFSIELAGFELGVIAVDEATAKPVVEGKCRWESTSGTKPWELRWLAFDVGRSHARPVVGYLRSRR
ncbi:MAG: hypothetical protein OXH68_20595 [Gammaproteobacteria bacterium]|nr:hypothetical protein [Gammaproteobacteria bacterium]